MSQTVFKAKATDRLLIITAFVCGRDKMLLEAAEFIGFVSENVSLINGESGGKLLPSASDTFDYIYVDEGNPYKILMVINACNLRTVVKKSMLSGAVYVGISAGAMLAGKDIYLAKDFEKNEIGLTEKELEGFQLIDGAVIPHYSRDEFKCYLRNTSEKDKDRYKEILSVPDGEVFTAHYDTTVNKKRV